MRIVTTENIAARIRHGGPEGYANIKEATGLPIHRLESWANHPNTSKALSEEDIASVLSHVASGAAQLVNGEWVIETRAGPAVTLGVRPPVQPRGTAQYNDAAAGAPTVAGPVTMHPATRKGGDIPTDKDKIKEMAVSNKIKQERAAQKPRPALTMAEAMRQPVRP